MATGWSYSNTSPTPTRVQITKIFKDLLSYDFVDHDNAIANGLPIAEARS